MGLESKTTGKCLEANDDDESSGAWESMASPWTGSGLQQGRALAVVDAVVDGFL